VKTITIALFLIEGILLIAFSTKALSEIDKPICFKHKETHAIVRPCQTFKSDKDAYTLVYCMDSNENMQPFKPNIDYWEQLEGDICVPEKKIIDVPRGMDSSDSSELNQRLVKKKFIAQIQATIKDPGKAMQFEIMFNTLPHKEQMKLIQQFQAEIQSQAHISSERQYWNEINEQLNESYEKGNYSRVIELAEKAYQYALKNFGKTDDDTMTNFNNLIISINNLAVIYDSQGRYTEAEPLYKHCLKLNEDVLGQRHPDTLSIINNLALLYQAQGRYAKAEPLFIRCLELRKDVLGLRHPDTITSINSLAGLYYSQRMYSEAEPLYKKCLQLSEDVLGPKHQYTVSCLNNLAVLYNFQGRYFEAETLHKHCIRLFEEILGP